MNTSIYSSDHSWSRRCSTETVFSIQGKETDIVRDTSDTGTYYTDHSADETDLEYEPFTEPEEDGPVSCNSSGGSDNEIIATKVIEVSMRDDGDLVFADSEQTESNESDSEIDLHDYWYCAQCLAANNNPLYRYCEKCFKVRKNFFPPRPKRKQKRNFVNPEIPRLDPDRVPQGPEIPSLDPDKTTQGPEIPRFNPDKTTQGPEIPRLDPDRIAHEPVLLTRPDPETVPPLSQDSGVESQGCISSQDLSQNEGKGGPSRGETVKSETTSLRVNVILDRLRKRRADSADRKNKRMKMDYSDSGSDTESERVRDTKSADPEIAPLVKMVSDPSISVHDVDTVKITKMAIINSLKDNVDLKDDMCIVCLSRPKSGVFVHGRIAHICCCYGCALKVWAKAKRCPVCNCRVSNVLRAVVM